MSILRNKEGLMYTLIIGLAIGAFLIFITFLVWGDLSQLFMKNTVEQANVASYQRLIVQIDNLLKNPELVASTKMPLMISPDYTIVGFNKEWNNKELSDGCEPSEVMIKPTRCQKNACLCLYRNSNEKFSKMKLIDCRVFNNVNYFSSMAYWFLSKDEAKWTLAKTKFPNIPSTVMKNQVGYKYNDDNPAKKIYPTNADKNSEYYSPFVLYGQCDGWLYDEDLNTKNYYVEKITKDRKTSIFINYDSELNNYRVEEIKKIIKL
jgi:hypothetical protein